MSIYPCDFHGQRVRGALGAAYVTAMDGTARYKRRLRLCSQDLAELLGRYGLYWELVADEGESDLAALCASCGAVCSNSVAAWAVFATIFPKGEGRQDYYAPLHEEHAEQYIAELGLKLDTSR